MTLEAGLAACRLLHYAAVLALFGAALYPAYAGAEALEDQVLAVRLRAALIGSAVLALVSGIGWFALTTASMAGSLAGAVDPQTLGLVLTQTDFGPLWVARLVGIGVLLVMAMAGMWSRSMRVPFIGLAGLVLASLAGAGHGRITAGSAGVVHLAADSLHLLAAGAWLGGLVPLGWAVRGWMGAADDAPPPFAQRMLQRFSGVGALAVAGLIATGLVNGWFLVGSIAALWTTLYGVLLSIKVLVFLAMLAFAVVNRQWLTPRLAAGAAGTQDTLAILRRHIIFEQLLGVIVVALVSVLGLLQPAN